MIKLRVMLLLFPALLLASCGGGGGGSASSAPARTVVVKLSCNDTFPANLVGLQVTISLPVGISAATDTSGLVLPSVVAPSGVTANNAVVPSSLALYTAPTATTDGSLSFVLASTAVGGFGAGEFAQVTLTAAAGSNPPIGAIVPSGFKPIDASGNVVQGLTPRASASFQ